MNTIPKLKKIDGVYHVKVTSNQHTSGKTKYISTGCDTKAEAEQVVRRSSIQDLQVAAKAGRLTQKVIGQIVTGKHLTCEKALGEYQKHMSISRSVHTVSSNLLVIGNWMRDAKVETLPPSAVTAKHIANWINSPKLDWSAATRRTALGAVRAFFEYCGSHGWIVADPARQVELDYSVMSHEQKEKVEREPFTDEELNNIIKELKHDWEEAQTDKHNLFRDSKDVLFWLVAVSIAKETGFRISDVANLEWRSFSEPGKVVVWTMKTGQRVEHKISESLQHLVGEVPPTDPAYVFPDQREVINNPKLRATLSMQFNRLCERLGIKKGKSFHSMRHYKATSDFSKLDKGALAKKLAESLSMDQIAALLGHANKKTTKGYVHEQCHCRAGHG